MSNSSILGGTPAPLNPRGSDVDLLGPSDTTDSGSDVATDLNTSQLDTGSEGAFPIAHGTRSDAAGTGERASADPFDRDRAQNRDILPDRIGIVPPGSSDLMGEVDDPDAHAVEDLALDDDAELDDDDAAASAAEAERQRDA